MREPERKFIRELIDLSARIKNLQYDIPSADAFSLKSEADGCRTEMERLNRFAEEHNIELNRFHRELDEIIGVLRQVDEAIEQKAEAETRPQEAGIWQNIRNTILWLLNLLFGWIAQTGRLLVRRTIQVLMDSAFPQLPPPKDDDPKP